MLKDAMTAQPPPEGVLYLGASMDGFIARPDGGLDFLEVVQPAPEDGDMGWSAFLAGLDAIVMGRKTYDQLLTFGVWPYGELPLLVWSRTLLEPKGPPRPQVEVTRAAPAALFAELGARGCRRVYVDGGETARAFMAAGLIVEINLTTLPVLIGSGISLYGPLAADLRWTLVDCRAFGSGMVRTSYRRIEDAVWARGSASQDRPV